MNKLKTWVGYCRVSTSKQEKEWDSLIRQGNDIINFYKGLDAKLLQTFSEVYSWKSSNRIELNNAIQYSIDHKVDYFVVYNIDRLSREWYAVYSMLKKKLRKNGITLLDCKGNIWEEVLVVKNDKIDLSEYEWALENPKEMNEIFTASTANSEWKTILQRTIPKEILLEQKWYHVRNSNFWYTNKRVNIEDGKATIQIRDSIKWIFIEEIFRLRAENLLSDDEIVNRINALGYISRQWIRLSVKQMQIFIKNPIYAWIIHSKWTGYKAIKTAYDGLVNVETWNRANRWKKTILEGINGEIKVIQWKIESDTVETQRRKKFDPNLPFRNLIKSSMLENQYITWSFSKNRIGQHYGYYHPMRKKWKVGENIKKEEFESKVIETLSNIAIDWILKEIFLDRFEMIFTENIKEVEENKMNLANNLNKVTKEIKELENKICNIDVSNTRILKVIENNLWELEEQQNNIIRQIVKFDEWGFTNINGFQKFCFNLLEHLDILAIQSQNIEELEVIFKFIFKETPTYNQIVNRTPELYPIFALQSQQKILHEGEFLENTGWQPKS